MTRQRDLEFSDVVRARWPIMHEALLQVGHRQTRNRGTIGGSLCHLDPSAELVSLATGYDATVTVAGPNGQRELPFAEFPVAYMTPGDRAERARGRRALPAMGAEARLCLRRVRPPARRLRHHLGRRPDRGRRRRQDHARLGDDRRHGHGAEPRARGRAGDRSDRCRPRSCSATPARAAASSKRSTTCMRRRPIASIWRRCCRAARWKRRMRASPAPSRRRRGRIEDMRWARREKSR